MTDSKSLDDSNPSSGIKSANGNLSSDSKLPDSNLSSDSKLPDSNLSSDTKSADSNPSSDTKSADSNPSPDTKSPSPSIHLSPGDRSDTDSFIEPKPELRRRQIARGEARVAVFRRTYDAPIEDVWDACTNPDRLRRWYVPVTGELRLGGTFQQGGMGSGVIERCEPPRLLTLSLGGGADEVELRLSPGDGGATVLELQHATTIDQHEIAGVVYDAIYCMGGGYYPRLQALYKHLRGELADDYDPLTFHERADMRPAIERGSAAMAALLEADTTEQSGRSER